MEVSWRKIGSALKGEGKLESPIEKGKHLFINGDNGIRSSIIYDVLYDTKNHLVLVYTKEDIYEVSFL